MTLSKYERETIINFNEEDKIATVYTMNKRLLSRLAKIAEQHHFRGRTRTAFTTSKSKL